MTCIVTAQNMWQSCDGAERASIVPAFCMRLSLRANWLLGINDAHNVLPAHRTIARQIPYFSALWWHWKKVIAQYGSLSASFHYCDCLAVYKVITPWHLVAMHACRYDRLQSGRQLLQSTFQNTLVNLGFIQRLLNASHLVWDKKRATFKYHVIKMMSF